MTAAPLAPAPPPTAKPNPRSLLSRLLMLVVGGVLGLLVGKLLGVLLKPAGGNLHLSRWDLLALPIVWFISVLVHEVGHVLAGLSQGFRFVALIAGPLRLGIEDGRLRLRFNDQPALWGGLALMVPDDLTRFHERGRWLVAGGPLASVLLALLAGGIALALDGRMHFHLIFLAVMSGAIALATLIPSEIGGFASDGAQLIALGRREPVSESRALLAIVAGASLAGTRPRDYDAPIVQRIATLDGPPAVRLAAAMLVGLHALDRGESADAFFAMIPAHFLEVPSGLRQGYAAWLVWYHGVQRDDAELAAQWSAVAQGGMVDPPLRALAEASLAYARKDPAASRAAIARGLQGSSGLDPGTTHLVRDLLRALQLRLDGGGV